MSNFSFHYCCETATLIALFLAAVAKLKVYVSLVFSFDDVVELITMLSLSLSSNRMMLLSTCSVV